jgi:tetraacyldisaccharide 4'-kinase
VNLNKKGFLSYILLPISVAFYLLIKLRRALYRIGLLRTYSFDVPVIVVGNITVGGSGKTPIVIELIEHFLRQGKKVGAVSRGYGGEGSSESLLVNKDTDPLLSGDEPLLIATQTNAPVIVNTNRVQAVKDMIEGYDVEIIVSDDGLQHYSMGRAVEIAVVDGTRRFGNGFLLPSGPLREPVSRLKSVDFVINNGSMHPGEISSDLVPKMFINLSTLEQKDVNYFNNIKCHSIAGIGYPQRFFDTLTDLGVDVLPHPFPDHHFFSEDELEFNSKHPIIMTAKDCVKCRKFATNQMWYLLTETDLGEDFMTKLSNKL